MKVSEEFPSKTLKAADLKGKEPKLTIANVVREKIGDDAKMVVYFEGKDKGVVLNKGNSNTIADAYGDDTDGWLGHDVILFAVWTEYQGKPVQGLRFRIPTARDVAPRRPDPISSGLPPKQSVIPPQEDMNDDIPF